MKKAEILNTPTEICLLLEYAEKKVASGDKEMEWSKIVGKLNSALAKLCVDVITSPKSRIPTKTRGIG